MATLKEIKGGNTLIDGASQLGSSSYGGHFKPPLVLTQQPYHEIHSHFFSLSHLFSLSMTSGMKKDV